jgi:hypothetical protein
MQDTENPVSAWPDDSWPDHSSVHGSQNVTKLIDWYEAGSPKHAACSPTTSVDPALGAPASSEQ